MPFNRKATFPGRTWENKNIQVPKLIRLQVESTEGIKGQDGTENGREIVLCLERFLDRVSLVAAGLEG